MNSFLSSIPQTGPEAIVFLLFTISFGIGFLTGASIVSLLWLFFIMKGKY